jgi:hypothetical protein
VSALHYLGYENGALLAWFRSMAIDPSRLGFVQTSDPRILPVVRGVKIPHDVCTENVNRSEYHQIGRKLFYVLRIEFSSNSMVELIFDIGASFQWMLVLARSQKLAISDEFECCLEMTISTSSLKVRLLKYYFEKAIELGESLEQVALDLLILAKAVGLPLRSELDETIPDIIQHILSSFLGLPPKRSATCETLSSKSKETRNENA